MDNVASPDCTRRRNRDARTRTRARGEINYYSVAKVMMEERANLSAPRRISLSLSLSRSTTQSEGFSYYPLYHM